MSTPVRENETSILECRFCRGAVERLADSQAFRSPSEPALGYQGCTCGQYLLDEAARLVIDESLSPDHPARRWISAWIQIALSNRVTMPVLDTNIVAWAVRESSETAGRGIGR